MMIVLDNMPIVYTAILAPVSVLDTMIAVATHGSIKHVSARNVKYLIVTKI